MDREVVGVANGDRVPVAEDGSRDRERSISGLLQQYIGVPKRSDGLRPVAIYRRAIVMWTANIMMLTLKKLLASLRPELWVTSRDLMDACLQVPIPSASRKNLRFKFQGITHQGVSLQFGLS